MGSSNHHEEMGLRQVIQDLSSYLPILMTFKLKLTKRIFKNHQMWQKFDKRMKKSLAFLP